MAKLNLTSFSSCRKPNMLLLEQHFGGKLFFVASTSSWINCVRVIPDYDLDFGPPSEVCASSCQEALRLLDCRALASMGLEPTLSRQCSWLAHNRKHASTTKEYATHSLSCLWQLGAAASAKVSLCSSPSQQYVNGTTASFTSPYYDSRKYIAPHNWKEVQGM